MKVVFLIIVAGFFCSVYALEKNKDKNENQQLKLNQEKFSLIQEIKMQTQDEADEDFSRKSAFKAVLLSAVIPGAGEFYAESYWKSVLFAAIEIAAWSGYITYENRGDSKDKEMRRFGDVNWSEQRYWSRVYDLAVQNGDLQPGAIPIDADKIIIKDNNYDQYIETLRVQESRGGYERFTHTLPNTKTQQYYEMIYKYLGQFGSGWVELDQYGGWTYYDGGANLNNLTPNVSRYRNLRDKSNDFYRTATNMATIVLLNHLASAIDAAFTVRSYNKQLSYSLYAGQQYYAGERVNTYGVAISF